MDEVQDIWSLFVDFRLQDGSAMGDRDLTMVLRAAARCGSEALTWVESLLASHAHLMDEEALYRVNMELQAHRNGTFQFVTDAQNPRFHARVAKAAIPEDVVE